MSISSGQSGVLAGLGRLFRGQPERLALDYLLAAANPHARLAERVVWLTEVLRWVRIHRSATDDAADGEVEAGRAEDAPGLRGLRVRALRMRLARVRFLLRLLERHPEWKSA